MATKKNTVDIFPNHFEGTTTSLFLNNFMAPNPINISFKKNIKVIQNGIISSDENNFFEAQTNPIIQEDVLQENKNKDKKRINRYDLDIVSKDNISNIINFKTVALLKVLKRFLDFKHSNTKKNGLKIENLFFKFFPKLYKAKLVKDAFAELLALNIGDAKKFIVPIKKNIIRTIPMHTKDVLG